ncbi:MAG: FG-GAP-like repeat-containing protein [Candidatus Korobacteraceae bacterium]
MEFATQGQNLFASSGDGGAFSPPSCASNCLYSVYPAEDPYVTAVGGTVLTTTGPDGAWQSETAWNLSGGGINSDGFTIPNYQTPVINSLNQGSTTLRNVPDVAAIAENAYDCFDGGCDTFSGTSLSTPVWAAFLAMANEQANGASIGFLNPTIYAIAQGANYGNDFHDVTTGNNFNSSSPTLFSAVTGYDLVTGLGTPNGQGLLTALGPAQTGPNFALVSTPATLSVIQGSQQTSAITLQAVNGFSGTVSLRATVLGQPTGVTASLSQPSVSGAAASTLTVVTTSLTSNPNIPIAVTGTSGGLTQTTYIQLTVLLPDLVETAVSAPPASVITGETFSVSDTAQNIGQAPAEASVTRYYLSDMTTKTSGSFLLTGSRVVPSLQVGATSSGTVNVTVPPGLWPNTQYYLLACANDTGTVAEASSGSCAASTTTVVFSQPQAPTATTLTVTSGGDAVTSVSSGSMVTLTATVVSGGAAVAPGQVNFCDAAVTACTGIHLLGTAQLTSAGAATLKLHPGIGSHSYKAVFLGTVNDVTSSSSAAALMVTGKFQTSTTIAQSGIPGNYTLTADVAGYVNLETATSPTGTVSFLDTSNNNFLLGEGALVAGTPSLNWVNSQSPAAGKGPYSVAVGDFNGDGIPDLAVANYFDTTVTILLGNGDGTFTATAVSPQVDDPIALAVGDFNDDGKADLAVTYGYGAVMILLGNGDGTFTQKAVVLTGEFPFYVIVGDFNGDGEADLAVANDDNNTLTILLGNGDGTFEVAASPAAGEGPVSIAAGDLNGDGRMDLAVTSTGRPQDNRAGAVTILLGNGDGTFTKGAVIPATVDFPVAVAAGDFNGDGKLDLAVTRIISDTVTILLGNGDGTFTATPTSPATGQGPNSITVGDFNGDGKPDLAVSNEASSNVTILLGNGDGSFTTATVSPLTGVDPASIASGDFNGDGIPDIAVANYNYGNLGSVTALLREVQLGSATISDLSPVGTGTHQVGASYPGDSNYNPSVSATTALTAITGPVALVSTATATFTAVVNSTSSAQAVTLSNSGNAALSVGNISITGNFAQSNNCGSSVAAGGSCTINVTFTPLTGGALTGTLTITDNSNGTTGSTQTVSLSGTGQDFSFAPPSGSPTSATVAPGSPATYTLSVGGEGGLTGTVSFTCTGAPSEATCTVSPNPVTAGSSATNVTVNVTTTAPSVGTPRSRPLSPVPPLSPGLRGLLMLALVLAAMAWAIRRRNQSGVGRWQSTIVTLAAGLLLILVIAGCGGGGGGGGGTTSNPGTPAGTYTLTVTGIAGSGSSALSHKATLTLNVS